MSAESSIPEIVYGEFSRLVHNRQAQAAKLLKAQIELTYSCNLHCVHCYTEPYNTPGQIRRQMTYAEVIRLIDKIHAEGILWVCFTGGEIFMRKDFLEIYDYAYRKGFIITLFTNGTLIDDKTADRLAQARPFSIEISLYGATIETYDRVTKVPGSFERCLSGLRKLSARDLPIKLKASLMSLNAHEHTAMQELAASFGCELKISAVLYPRLDGDTSPANYRLPPEQTAALEMASTTPEDACEIIQSVENHPVPANLYRCGCGILSAHIDPEGKVGTCTWSRRDRFDFREVNLNTGMQALAQMIRSETYQETSACRTCTVFQHCDKIPEMAVLETGSPQLPVQHFCDVATAKHKLVHNLLLNPEDKKA